MNNVQYKIKLGDLTSPNFPTTLPSADYRISFATDNNTPTAEVIFDANISTTIQEKCTFDIYGLVNHAGIISIPTSGNNTNLVCTNINDNYVSVDTWWLSFKQSFIVHNKTLFGNYLNLDPNDVSSTFQTDTNSNDYCHFEIENHPCSDFVFTVFTSQPSQAYGISTDNLLMTFLNKDDKVILNNIDAITTEILPDAIIDIKFQCPDNNYYDFDFDNFSAFLNLSNYTTNPSFKDNELIFMLEDGITGDQNLGNFAIAADQQNSAIFNLMTNCVLTNGVYSLNTIFLNAGVLV
jgi:hypothetical protein